MKQLLFLIIAIISLSTSVNAGFLGGVLSSMTANALSSNPNSNASQEDKEKIKNKKIQAVFIEMGADTIKIDGDLETFETRKAVKEYQKWNYSEPTGKLSDDEKIDLLYLGNLLLKANSIELVDETSLKKSEQLLNDIIKEAKDTEKQSSTNTITKKIKKYFSIDTDSSVKPISERIKAILSKFNSSKKSWKELLNNKNIYYSKKWKTFYYYPKNDNFNGQCSDLNIANIAWKDIEDKEYNYHSFTDEIKPILPKKSVYFKTLNPNKFISAY